MKQLMMILMCALCALSCRRVPLYDAESGVYIKINVYTHALIDLPDDITKELPQKYIDKIDGRLPEKMQVNFYDIENHNLVTKAFMGPEGGYVDIAPGVYDILIFSIDNDYTRVDKMQSRGSIYAFTSQSGSRYLPMSKGENGESQPMECAIIHEPDHLYVARKESVIIPEHSVVDETVEIYANAATIIDTYILRAINIKNIQNIKNVEVAFSGQARCKYLWDGRYNQDEAFITVDCYVDIEGGELVTIFNTFGKQPNSYNYVLLSINQTSTYPGLEFVFDVTDQFDNPDNTNHVIIVSDEIDVPDSGSGGGGLDPEVSDWDEEHKNVDI